MTKLVSYPVDPAVPTAEYFPVSALYRLPRLTRALFEAMYKEQPPAWDPTMRIKRWFRTDWLDQELGAGRFGEKMYSCIGWNETMRKFEVIEMSALAAAEVNLPGKFVYPKYTVAPTEAQFAQGPIVVPIDPSLLCLFSQAEKLQSEIAPILPAVRIEPSSAMGPFHITWGAEVRRMYQLVEPGKQWSFNCGRLLTEQYRNGIDAPGRWEVTDVGVTWVSITAPDGEIDLRPEVAIPCRELEALEELVVGPFGAQIRRVKSQTGPGSGSGPVDVSQSSINAIAAETVKRFKASFAG